MKKIIHFFKMMWFVITFIVDSIKLLKYKAEQEQRFSEANS